MINNICSKAIEKIPSERTVIFEPSEGFSYSHHPFLTYFKGCFYAAWSCGKRNEDDCGQRIFLCKSENGVRWSKPHAVADPAEFGDPLRVYIAAGFYSDGERLNLYYSTFRYSPETVSTDGERPHADAHHIDGDVLCMTTYDGEKWEAPVSLGFCQMPNFAPQPIDSGRLLICGSIMFPYSDDKSGIGDYTLSGIYKDAFGANTPIDDSESIMYVKDKLGWDTDILCEGSFFQTDDHIIHMMLRTGKGIMWCAESRDDGESWSEPVPTEFSSDNAKFCFSRLPDGRFCCICNPLPSSGRNPLALFLSEDGENFNKGYILRDENYDLRFRGLYKGGIYGYPHSMVQDGYLYVIYSKRKETIEITRVSLSSLVP